MGEPRNARLKRRTLVGSAAWVVPVLVTASAVPAVASSVKTDLAIDVVDPPYALENWRPKHEIPIYKGSNGNRVAVRGSLPPMIRITNVGRVTAIDPSGSVELILRDYGNDGASWASNRVKAGTTNQNVMWTEDSANATAEAGARYRYTCRGALRPGQSIDIPLRYFVNPPFVHAEFNVLVAAWVEDQQEGDYDDNSLRIGHVPWVSAF